MAEHRPELADVLRSHGEQYLADHSASSKQRRVIRDVMCCKTAALGGHKAKCDRCGHEEFFYNSCRNRNCPKCQGKARARWLSERTRELLPVPYFHVVFTLPDELKLLALQNPRIIYGLLFGSASESLLQIAADPKHLGADIGFLAVLHTWGQTLDLHPHVHCVVPGGGFSPDRQRWVRARPRFFLPVRILSRIFRGKFLKEIQTAYERRRLRFPGSQETLRHPLRWKAFLKALRRHEWVVYSKPPFGGPQQVLKYLARYTHRVAISNQRILSLRDGNVTFQYKDYRCGNIQRTMTVRATEFIRRYLLHVLPDGLHRIRYYGLLANRCRKENLALARKLLGSASDQSSQSEVPPHSVTDANESAQDDSRPHEPCCPACKAGRMVIVERIPAPTALPSLQPRRSIDTS
jgi:hypothetical protein